MPPASAVRRVPAVPPARRRLGRHLRRGAPVAGLLAVAALAWAAGATGAAAPMQSVVVTMKPAATAVSPGDVERTLRRRADRDQAGIRAELGALVQRGQVQSWTPLWIANAVAVTGTAQAVQALKRRADVASVVPDAGAAIAPAAVTPAEPGIALVGAPAAWSAGNTGQGVVVASLDSGVDAAHPALAPSWRGGANSWYDPYGQHATPADPTGHGTAAMGIMVGAGGIGVAPGARWISGRVFDDQGGSSIAAIHKAFQWVLDPDGDPATLDAPSVVLNAWTFTTIGCDTTFQPDLQALVAADILPVFAAGNMGPGASTNGSPANLPEAFSVGATDASDVVAPFSSRGPAVCKHAQVPEVVAPGVGVRSSWIAGGFATLDGTSFAAPHVAGAAALILSAAPGTTQQGIRDALTATAVDLGAPGVDDVSGAGRIDIGAAVAQAVATPPPPDTTPPATFHVHAGDGTTADAAVGVGAVVVDLASPVTAAEAFIDTPGPTGSGLALTALDGAFDAQSEQVGGTVAAATVAILAPGFHQILIRGRDASGNWGAFASSPFVVDRSAPAVTGGPDAIRLTEGDHAVWTVVATDAVNGAGPASAIVAAQADDPGATVTPVDGALDGSVERVRVRLAAGSRPGTRSVAITVTDAAGNRTVRRYVVVTRPAGVIFADAFRRDLRRWDRVVGAPRVAAGLLRVPLGVGSAFVEDTTPDAETGYRLTFPLTLDAAPAARRTLVEGRAASGRRVFTLELKAGPGGRPMVRAVSGGATTWIPLSRVTRLTLEWHAGRRMVLRAGRATTGLTSAVADPLEAVRIGAVGSGPSARRPGRLRIGAVVSTRIPDGEVALG